MRTSCPSVDAYGCSLVEITGGEPLLQEDVYALMERLLERGRTVLLETGGHRPIDSRAGRGREDRRRQVSGERRGGRNDWANLDSWRRTTK